MEFELLIDPDELEDDLEEHGEHLKQLIIRTEQQSDDIRELKEELEYLKRNSTISPEDSAAI